jgi:hypothetical protein
MTSDGKSSACLWQGELKSSCSFFFLNIQVYILNRKEVSFNFIILIIKKKKKPLKGDNYKGLQTVSFLNMDDRGDNFNRRVFVIYLQFLVYFILPMY